MLVPLHPGVGRYENQLFASVNLVILGRGVTRPLLQKGALLQDIMVQMQAAFSL